MQKLLAEAQLEAGHDSLETMDFGDETFDDSGHPDDLAAEPVGGPLLSEFFKTCSQEHQYFISKAEVDQFKDDVRRRAGESSATNSTMLGACTENWTAAKAVDDNKITVFDQTGIFLVACHHGIIECVMEMKRSGELAKYGLTAVNRLLGVCSADQAIGHDIACSSCKTIATSSIGAKAVELNLQVVVNTFHGFSHDHHCTFLYNNYVQALQIIETNTPVLEESKQLHNLMDTDFINWQNEEYDYLSNIAVEPTSNAIAVAYIERLEKLYFAEAMYGRLTSIPFMTYTPANFTPASSLNAAARNSSRAFESEHASALRKYELQLNVVEYFEHRHSITERWLPHDPRYVEAARYSQECQFIRSVEELEGLVVQRLFELSKANLAGTGYKMRKHISKAITRCSAAIRSALEKYNKLAPLQNPPRPVLDYSEIVGYASLGEFLLLKHSRHNILMKPWTISANREMAMKYFKLVRLHEEIVWLNVEIKRLQSWVEHEDRTILEAIDSLLTNDPESLLVAKLKILCHKHRSINNIHRKQLQQIYALNQYTGGRPATDQTVMAPNEDRDDEGSLDNHEDDAVNEEAMRLEDLVSHLTL
ncbi:hypothetical protein BDR05DRAFT_978864 [Suillus weaverae]|nr:hypothetical protein BDR05DRAFT_978864 [Suillus weaverae]